MTRLSLVWGLLALTSTLHPHPGMGNLWKSWWDYQGITGPKFWGFINPNWKLCSKGRNQSPIDIDPTSLLFDPGLSALEISGDSMTGILQNNGHDVTFYLRNYGKSRWGSVNVTGGPLSYNYQLDQIKFRFGLLDEHGSEHWVANRAFPVEIQLLAYNSELYSSYEEAESSPQGLAAIAVFAHISDKPHKEFDLIVNAVNSTLYQGQKAVVKAVRLQRLLPDTEQYVTYTGSTTFPPCHESVTWVVYNQPVFISHAQLTRLRTLRKGTRKNPVMSMGGNLRPVQHLNQRTVRCNIDFRHKKCAVTSRLVYKENDWLRDPDIR